MRTVIVLCMLALVGASAPSHPEASSPGSKVLFLGSASLSPIRSHKWLHVRYRYLGMPADGSHSLVVTASRKGHSVTLYRYSPEIGQEEITAVRRVRFGPNNELVGLGIWSVSGAHTIILRILVLDKSGRKLNKLAEIWAPLGIKVLDVTGNGENDIVGGYGEVGADDKRMKVYSWNGKVFHLARTVHVRRALSFKIRTGK